MGIAPLVIGIFFFGSVQLISVGILGEYIGSIHTHVQKRPLVVERERVNFEHEPGLPATEPMREASRTRCMDNAPKAEARNAARNLILQWILPADARGGAALLRPARRRLVARVDRHRGRALGIPRSRAR